MSIPLNKGYNTHVPHATMNIPALSHASVVSAILKITRPIDSILANKGRQKHIPLLASAKISISYLFSIRNSLLNYQMTAMMPRIPKTAIAMALTQRATS